MLITWFIMIWFSVRPVIMFKISKIRPKSILGKILKVFVVSDRQMDRHIWDPTLVVTMHADVPAPNSAGPSARTVLTEKLDIDGLVQERRLSCINLSICFLSSFIGIHWFHDTLMDWLSSKMTIEMPQNLAALRVLTHYGLMTPYGDIDLGQHWLR